MFVPQGLNFGGELLFSLTSISISRFILNLRRIGPSGDRIQDTAFVTSRFSSFLTGNFGEDLAIGLSEVDPDDSALEVLYTQSED